MTGIFARVAAITSGVVVCVLLGLWALSNLISGVLADPRADVRRDLITTGIRFVPNSAPVAARLAEADMVSEDRDLEAIGFLAQRAVNLSPWDYRYRLLLASVREAAGDRPSAEQALEAALSLAPSYPDVHWRLANLLLREGKLQKSVAEFRLACSADPRLLDSTYDLLWRVTAGNLLVIRAVTPRNARSQLSLARFLMANSRLADAITVFSGIDRDSLTADPAAPSFIESLIKAGHLTEARGLWIGLVSGAYEQPGRPLPSIWNGGFETDISPRLDQFDWMIGRNEYAVPAVNQSVSHSGNRSLRIDFTGRDTTRLDGQVKQIIQLRGGVHYMLAFFTKTERLETPEGPRVVISDVASGAEIAGSSPLAPGSSDWHRVAFEFTAPAEARAALLAIKRVPIYSYDKPTKGAVWFDDFVLTEK